MKHLSAFNESKNKKSKVDWDKFFEDISDDKYFKKFKFTQLDDMCAIIRKHVEKQLK